MRTVHRPTIGDTINWTSQPDDTASEALEPLLTLKGVWHGQGTGLYGPIETHAVSRGRWRLLTGTIFVPETDTVTYVSTQVFGYDADGLLLHYFDTAGAFGFRGEQNGDGLKFIWKRGGSKLGEDVTDLWKTSEFTPGAGGKIDFCSQSMELAIGNVPLTFSGTWKHGPRKAAFTKRSGVPQCPLAVRTSSLQASVTILIEPSGDRRRSDRRRRLTPRPAPSSPWRSSSPNPVHRRCDGKARADVRQLTYLADPDYPRLRACCWPCVDRSDGRKAMTCPNTK